MRAVGGLERVERAEEVGPFAIEHVHEQQAREIELSGALPQPGGVDLDAHHGVDDEDRGLAHAQGAERVGNEARVAGSVDQVDLAVLPFERGQRGRDRHLTRLLIGVGVGYRRAVDHRAQPVDRSGLEKQRLV